MKNLFLFVGSINKVSHSVYVSIVRFRLISYIDCILKVGNQWTFYM